MITNHQLFSLGDYNLRLNHLLIVGILILSFSISFLIRTIPGDFGWELNEFDPFFNYRATSYIVENGFDSYLEWNDELSWYPIGRDISSNSQVALHLITAISYQIFGGEMELYDFTILFPVIIGSLTTIVIFALVRVLAGTTAGLLSSLFFSISLPILLRGHLGWFKSEPLGLFLGITATYFFISGIYSQKNYTSILKMIISGFSLALAFSSWGGTQFFIIPIGIMILGLPFFKETSKSIYFIPVFLFSLFTTVLFFERPGISVILGLGGLSLIFPTIFLISSNLIQKKFKFSSTLKFNSIYLLILVIIILSSFFILNFENSINLPTYRYLNSLNPFLITNDPLIESVSEHAITQTRESFYFQSTLLIFVGFGIWKLLTNSKKQKINQIKILFILTTGIVGVYMAATFMRLELFAAYSIILLSSIGISFLLKNIFSKNHQTKISSNLFKIFSLIGIFVLLVTPLIIPSNSTIFSTIDKPTTIFNGGTQFPKAFPDWIDSLEWIKNNTPPDSVIASWWDYGYWIQTKADRASIADNSTVNDHIIKRMAEIFFEEPDLAWQSFQNMEVDYFILFVTGERLSIDHQETQKPMYLLGGGGDESKKFWFAKIAGVPIEKFIHSDLSSGTDIFWDDTFLGKITPFKPIGYVNFATQQMSPSYQDGWVGIYEKNTDYVDNIHGPFTLVYSSENFDPEKNDYLYSVLIYEINDNYKISD